MLDTVYNQGIKISMGAFRTSPVEILYVESNEESLYRRRECLSLKYALKLSSTPSNPTFDTVFIPKYANIFTDRPNAISTLGIRVKHIIYEANIDINIITPSVITDVPTRIMKVPIIVYNL